MSIIQCNTAHVGQPWILRSILCYAQADKSLEPTCDGVRPSFTQISFGTKILWARLPGELPVLWRSLSLEHEILTGSNQSRCKMLVRKMPRMRIGRILTASRRGQDTWGHHRSAAISHNQLSWQHVGKHGIHVATCNAFVANCAHLKQRVASKGIGFEWPLCMKTNIVLIPSGSNGQYDR